MKTVYPIEYKFIPTQYSFLIESDGTVQSQVVTQIPAEQKFSSEAEARKWVEELTEVI